MFQMMLYFCTTKITPSSSGANLMPVLCAVLLCFTAFYFESSTEVFIVKPGPVSGCLFFKELLCEVCVAVRSRHNGIDVNILIDK